MNTNKEIGNPFGTVYLNLATALLKARKHAELHFCLYVSCRVNIDKWQYSETDIRTTSAISRNTVKKLCQQYHGAGIFELDGTTRNGSRKYKLNKERFQMYAQGKTPLAEVVQVSAADRVSITETCQPVIGETVNQGQGGLSTIDTLDYQPLTANNKEIIKKEKEDTHIRACVCASSHSKPEEPDQSVIPESPQVKANLFLALVNQLKSEMPEYGILIGKSAFDQVCNFFSSVPDYSSDALFDLFHTANSSMWFLKHQHQFIDPIKNPLGLQEALANKNGPGEGFDHYFYSRRSNNLAFFLKHYSNVYAESHETL